MGLPDTYEPIFRTNDGSGSGSTYFQDSETGLWKRQNGNEIKDLELRMHYIGSLYQALNPAFRTEGYSSRALYSQILFRHIPGFFPAFEAGYHPIGLPELPALPAATKVLFAVVKTPSGKKLMPAMHVGHPITEIYKHVQPLDIGSQNR